ncbi:hypothetical protein [Caballeronia sp. Lep1P3]|uniref:hypothetical protein n=1 Tax=Caballeronia sp. Lep1P3 TaxID=2878150 RepID=UPI001FD0CE2F|nr:hypothetical protein [Caballeronia sp. Lep1P3]
MKKTRKDRRLLWTRNMVARAFRHQSAILPDFGRGACESALAAGEKTTLFSAISGT